MNEMKKVILTMVVAALATSGMAQSDCGELLDANQDGLIGVEDLMNLLSHFGDSDFDFDGVFDSVDMCVNEEACNYDSDPTEPCQFYDAIGDCGGDCMEDLDGDGFCDTFYGACEGQTELLYQGYNYALTSIGAQCWFAENLKTIEYQNGDPIPANLNEEEWESTDSGAYATNQDDSTSYNDIYGLLYNHHAVIDDRKLCPTGWHIPTDAEFMTLEIFLGMTNDEAEAYQWRGTDQGYQMKSDSLDSPEWNGSNSSGFSAVPGGYRRYHGSFQLPTIGIGYWWTSNPEIFINRALWTEQDKVQRRVNSPNNGFSVRCLKDTE